MSSIFWIMPTLLGLAMLGWVLKSEVKDLFVFSAFARPFIPRHFPFLVDHASHLLTNESEDYMERYPLKSITALERITGSEDGNLSRKAIKAIIDNIEAVAAFDEGAAARALLTVINKCEPGSLTQHRALAARPGIIDSLGDSDPVQALLLAQKGISADETDDELNRQSCDLALRHLTSAFNSEPVIAAHAACNIARKTTGAAREKALWTLLSKLSAVTESDFESGHAAAEQSVLLSVTGSPLHQAALGMWEWHIKKVMVDSPADLISKMFYGFGITTAKSENKLNLYEHGFDFLLRNTGIIKEYPEKVVTVSLNIGLRSSQETILHNKSVEVWTVALRELCRRDLRLAIQSANQAMTFTAPGSQFERQAQLASVYLRRMDDDIAGRAHMIFNEDLYAPAPQA